MTLIGRFNLASDDSEEIRGLSKANINLVSYSSSKIAFSKLQDGK
jgi:hypothetical protein